MTTRQLHSREHHPSTTQRPVAANTVVTVIWRIDAASLARVLPATARLQGPEKSAQRNGCGDARLTLIVERALAADGTETLSAIVEAQAPFAAGSYRIAQAASREIAWQQVRSTGEAAWLHIDIEAEGWSCALSVRPQRDASLAYARTDLFRRLGIAGGRYEVLRAVVDSEARKERLEASA